MVSVEQPVGTGFSQGTPTATDEKDVAKAFLGFFKNFLDTFGLQDRKIYITGESYAGYYVPYIADAMLNAKDKKYYDVEGIMIYDPSTSSDVVQEQSETLCIGSEIRLADHAQSPLLPVPNIGRPFSPSIRHSVPPRRTRPTPVVIPLS